MRGAVQRYHLVPGHGSSLLCLCLNQTELQVLEKAKPLELFLCLSVNPNSVQFNMWCTHGGQWYSVQLSRLSRPGDPFASALLYTFHLAPKTPGIASDGVTAHQNSHWWFLAGAVPVAVDILEMSQQTLPDACKFIQNCFHEQRSALFMIPFSSLFGEHLSN